MGANFFHLLCHLMNEKAFGKRIIINLCILKFLICDDGLRYRAFVISSTFLINCTTCTDFSLENKTTSFFLGFNTSGRRYLLKN